MENKQRVKKNNPKYAKVWILETPNEEDFKPLEEVRDYLNLLGFHVRHMEMPKIDKNRIVYQVYFFNFQRLDDLKKINPDVLWMTNILWNKWRKGDYVAQAKHVQQRINFLLDKKVYDEIYNQVGDYDLLELESDLMKTYAQDKKDEALRAKGYFIFRD